MIRLYNVLRKFCYLPNSKETKLVEATETVEVDEPEVIENAGLTKALETYRKLIDRKDLVEPLTEKEQEKLENKIKEIENREVVDKIVEHDPVEILELSEQELNSKKVMLHFYLHLEASVFLLLM